MASPNYESLDRYPPAQRETELHHPPPGGVPIFPPAPTVSVIK